MRAAPSGKAGGPRTAGDKQDWIGDQLRRVYDEALHEDIPQEMLVLLDRLDGTSRTDEDKDDSSDPKGRGGRS